MMTRAESERLASEREFLYRKLSLAVEPGVTGDDLGPTLRFVVAELRRLYAIEDRAVRFAALSEQSAGYAGRYITEGADPRSLFAHGPEVSGAH